MNIEIIGRHALLFDDDTNAAFINSDDALVEWNSLLIDRYDVRHLLSSPPPSRRRRNPQTSHSSSADGEIDYERYLDLPSPSAEQEEDAKPESVGGFNAVPFSYGNYEDFNDKKIAEAESEISGFQPPFPVPDSLVQNLPPTEKVHQIIARTALFVSKNGGQSEIVLRVKQGDNPTFGFLMPDHHLHPYFRFLVDQQNLLQSKNDGQPDKEKASTTENASGAGALSLLGSVYGTGEDEDGGVEHVSSCGEYVSGKTVDVDATKSHAPGKTIMTTGKDEPVSKRSLPSKEDAPVEKRNPSLNALKAERTSSMRKGESLGSLSSVPDKLRASSLPPIPMTEKMVTDPPSDMKRLVDKIVEFIIKNGRQFETVLMEQDRGHGRFPFLLPSNIFHPYYLKVLQQAMEPKLTVRSFHNEKEDFRGHIPNRKRSILRENENKRVESDDIPLDSERKEKFKMVINKTNKEGSEAPAKATQPQLGVQVDAAQAAAILQAATRGIKLPNLGILSGQPSNEAESSDAQMTHEQKLKAERLKRAKMFVAQLKSGAAPLKGEPSRGLSAEPQGSGADNHLAAKERERSTTPLNYDTADKKVKSEKEHLNEERRSKRKYRARAETPEELEDDEDEEVDEREGKRSHRYHTKKHRSRKRSVEVDSEEKDDEERDYSHVKRRHQSHRTSHKHDEMDKSNEERHHKSSRKKKHRSPSSYEEDDHESEHGYSRKRHHSRHSSHEESDDEVDSDHKNSRKKHKHRSHRTSHHSRDKHRKSHSSKRKQKLDVSSEEGQRDHSKADRHKKGLNSDREELEEGEISSKSSGQSRGEQPVDGASKKPLMDLSTSHQGRRSPSQPIETTEVPDDLRAKIRAMLMSTM